MFIGHYGPALAAPAIRRIPLWRLFVAVQLVDIAWGALVALGIEKVRIEPGFTPMSPFDLYHMPYTHSLLATLIWGAGAALIYALIFRRNWAAGIVIGLAVISHWVLDFLVHVPDLALWPGGPKVGLGWWNSWPLGLGSEILVLLVGFVIYLRVSEARNTLGKVAPWLLMVFLAFVQWINLFGTLPTDGKEAGPVAAAGFLILALAAAGVDATRRYKS